MEYSGLKRGRTVGAGGGISLRKEERRGYKDDYECPVCRVRRRENAGNAPKCHQCGAAMVPLVSVEGGGE